MSNAVSGRIEQDGYNAYGVVDGKRVPVLSTSMGNCWHQDDQRAFCTHLVARYNQHEALVHALRECQEYFSCQGDRGKGGYLDRVADMVDSLL